MGLIYLDSCLVIYLLEWHPSFGPRVAAALAANSGTEFASSPLALMECLVKPMADGDRLGEARYRDFFGSLVMLGLDVVVFEQAARLRAARAGLRTPDAIHLAAARQHGCQALWTGDDRLVAASDGFVVNVTAPPVARQ
ncbi:MAG: PIN domain-containing protein [Actinomycetia bacterium]|nr:PIN domain-containing protein [Actinomycetes bacterium]